MTKLLSAVSLVLVAALPAAAQSLAAIAERSSAHTPAATKTYTNADLEGVHASTGAVASEAPASEPLEIVERSAPAVRGFVVEEDMGEGRVNFIIKPEKHSSAENEPYWRRITRSVKGRIGKAESDLGAAEAMLENAGGRDREKLMELRAQRVRDLELLNAEYAGHVNRAKALGVPLEWLR